MGPICARGAETIFMVHPKKKKNGKVIAAKRSKMVPIQKDAFYDREKEGGLWRFVSLIFFKKGRGGWGGKGTGLKFGFGSRHRPVVILIEI